MKTRSPVIAAVLAAALIVVASSLPWKAWVEIRLQAFLEAQGFHNVRLSVSSIGFTGTTLKDISIGNESPLHLNDLVLGYSVPALLSGNLRDINVGGLSLDMRKQGDQWNISGWEAEPQGSPSNKDIIPVTRAALDAIPFDAIKLKDSYLHIVSDQWHMDIPLDLSWHKQLVPELAYEAKTFGIKAHAISVITGDLALNATLNERDRKWNGPWHIDDIKMTGIGPDVPLLNGKGTVSAGADQIMIEGQFASMDKKYTSDLHIDYFFNEPKKSRLEILKTELPWNEGIISATDVTIPFEGQKDLNINFKVQHVSLAALLQQLTGKQTSATGRISGSLPVTLGTNGVLTVHAGKLMAEEPGMIAMPPDTIPGDNEQVAVARDILKNFHYTLLSIEVDNGKSNSLSVMMKLEGSNPDVYEGRAAKLNVHLTGDVLNFLQQNLLIFTNPQKLLWQGKNAQP